MTFPLTVHLNSSGRALAPNIFLAMLCVEIFVDIMLMCMILPVIMVAVARAAALHPNFRIITIATILHYIIGNLARFVIIFYELNDLPVTKEDPIIFAADIIRDHIMGYLINSLGVHAFERYVATHYWEWYESHHRSTLWIAVIAEVLGSGPSLVNVMLCEYDFYRHELNFYIFGFILFWSGILYIVAYTDNTCVLRSLKNFPATYTVNQQFQVRENLRVLQFTAISVAATLPIVAAAFVFYGVFFFAPLSWEKERYLSVAAVDCCFALYGVAYFGITVRSVREYHHEIHKIRAFKVLANVLGWKTPSSESSVDKSSKIDDTQVYFNDLYKAWA